MEAVNEPTLRELLELSAVDGVLFSQEFFPKTVRQKPPKFHYQVWNLLDSLERYVSIQIFRGGAKTSLLRLFAAKRIAFGLAHTILYIGKSEGHAERSAQWIRRAVEYNHRYNQVFRLRKGSKWQGTQAEIWHGTDDYPVWVLAAGIEGAVRGINIDDYRPDLIVLDDVISDENAATDDQRNKLNDLILGAVKESLAPASEAPDAKLVMLNTPLNREDASSLTEHDEEWAFLRCGCWTPETANLPLEQRQSAWPERWSDETLRAEKRAAIARNKTSVFAREKECVLIDAETCAFKPTWLKRWQELPEHGETVLVIDPVPKPTAVQIAKGLHGKDYECLMVVRRFKNLYFCCEYAVKRGHDPGWTVATFFTLALKWRIRRVVVESVAYQSTLAWLLEQEMKRRGVYYQIEERTDKRSKYDKIVDPLVGPGSQGALYVHDAHHELIMQWNDYPSVAHDDVIECFAVGVESLSRGEIYEGEYEYLEEEEEMIPDLEDYRSCP
ncbi:MAG: hypothetical protein GTO00_09165 [Deltaproteobacteria bacterium]|nr:hypothetical protein [Deltaproteobacteria bacterium]